MSSNPLEIDPFINVDVFVKEINEDITDLNEAMRTITARAAYYAMQAAKAKKQANRIDNIVKATEAKLKVEHRKALTSAAQDLAEAEGGKPDRVTAEMVESAVFTDTRMNRLLNIQLDSDEVRTVCNVAVDAFRTRRDMLKGLGHLATEEMRSQLRVHGNQAGQAARTSGKTATEEYRARRAARETTTAE